MTVSSFQIWIFSWKIVETRDINKNIIEVEKNIQEKNDELERNNQARRVLKRYIEKNMKDINNIINLSKEIASTNESIGKTNDQEEKAKIKKALNVKVHKLRTLQENIRASSEYLKAMSYLSVLEPNKPVNIEDSARINSILERSKNASNALEQKLSIMQGRLQDLKKSRSEGQKQLGKSDFLPSGFDNLPPSSTAGAASNIT